MTLLTNDKTGAFRRCRDRAHAYHMARILGWVDYTIEDEK